MALDFKNFENHPHFILATVDSEGKPHTRIIQYLFEIDGDLYFCTSSEKNMSKQMKENPHVSIITYAPDFSMITRVNGEVTFLDDLNLKTRALDENPGIKSIYQDPTNPIFEICVVKNLVTE